jgi:hypothetical protein
MLTFDLCLQNDISTSSYNHVGTETSSIGVATDPDCLGPCEPGTNVLLEGIQQLMY